MNLDDSQTGGFYDEMVTHDGKICPAYESVFKQFKQLLSIQEIQQKQQAAEKVFI